jgi:8-oxo-dGTP pyrophosphatase MutT (NUDIX family)
MADSDVQQKDTYFIAAKAFIEKDGKLLILKDNFGDWDLPGGRIKKDEFHAPLEQVVKRKMKEELGPNIKYQLGKPEIFMRHERVEAVEGNPTVRIFALGYICPFESGEINLSPRHTEMLWVDVQTFEPEKYFKGGWLEGLKEYIKLKANA